MNNYWLINLIALLSLLHISITFNRCSLYLTLSPNVIDLGGKRGVQSFNRFVGIAVDWSKFFARLYRLLDTAIGTNWLAQLSSLSCPLICSCRSVNWFSNSRFDCSLSAMIWLFLAIVCCRCSILLVNSNLSFLSLFFPDNCCNRNK